MKNSNQLGFIVGHYKSGSTWLSHALALHPDIRSLHEMHIFRYLREEKLLQQAIENLFLTSSWGYKGMKSFPRHWLATYSRPLRGLLGLSSGVSLLPNVNVPNRLQSLGWLGYYRLKQKLFACKSQDDALGSLFTFLLEHIKPGRYLIEKTPTNIFELDKIKTVFPNSKIISIHRDPRDFVVSDQYHVKRAYNSEIDVEQSIARWGKAMQQELDMSQKYTILQTSYEDMQEDPHRVLSEILEYLELEFTQDLLDEMVYKSSFEFTTGRNRGESDASQFQRSGVSGGWHNELNSDDLKIIYEKVGPLMKEFGYSF